MRSLLFVPADSARKLEKSLASGADAVILDLEDSVAPSAKEAARALARDFLRAASTAAGRPRLYVRVNPLDSGLTDADLDAVMPANPEGLVLPKSRHGADVQHLAGKVAVREAEYGLTDGATRIIAIATETAGAIFGMATYAHASPRLAGLSWGAEDLSAALGAEASRDTQGRLTSPYRLARDLTLFAARAAETEPVDTVFVDFRDMAGLEAECAAARRDGFTCKLAIHPAQVPVINAAFTPSDTAVAEALAIVDAFAATPGAGVVSRNGAMLDRPHLVRAQRVLARARRDG